jgi:hypothetical protein
MRSHPFDCIEELHRIAHGCHYIYLVRIFQETASSLP